MNNLITLEDGRRKFMCPKDGTWGTINEDQYRGLAEMRCQHPTCDWSGTIDLEAAEAAEKAKKRKPPETHF